MGVVIIAMGLIAAALFAYLFIVLMRGDKQ